MKHRHGKPILVLRSHVGRLLCKSCDCSVVVTGYLPVRTGCQLLQKQRLVSVTVVDKGTRGHRLSGAWALRPAIRRLQCYYQCVLLLQCKPHPPPSHDDAKTKSRKRKRVAATGARRAGRDGATCVSCIETRKVHIMLRCYREYYVQTYVRACVRPCAKMKRKKLLFYFESGGKKKN